MSKSDDKTTRIEQKIDKLGDHLASIDVTLAKQQTSLEEHIKRTNMLEDKLTPVEKHVSQVQGAMRLVGLMAAAAAIAEGIAVFLEYLGSK